MENNNICSSNVCGHILQCGSQPCLPVRMLPSDLANHRTQKSLDETFLEQMRKSAPMAEKYANRHKNRIHADGMEGGES